MVGVPCNVANPSPPRVYPKLPFAQLKRYNMYIYCTALECGYHSREKKKDKKEKKKPPHVSLKERVCL